MRVALLVAFVASLLSLAACGDAVGDSHTEQACRQFRAYSQDALDGVLTDAEWRAAIADVEEDAAIGSDNKVADSSRTLLAIITQGGGVEEQAAGVAALDEACTDAGL